MRNPLPPRGGRHTQQAHVKNPSLPRGGRESRPVSGRGAAIEQRGAGCTPPRSPSSQTAAGAKNAASLRTKILDFRGFDSGIILNLRGIILMSIRNFPESLSQAILVGIILVGRLGACGRWFGRHDLSKATSLTRPHLFCVFRRVKDQNTPPENKTPWKIGFQSAKSGGG